MLSGFINLYKNRDMTSNKALSILKSHLKKNNITTKAGHFGTLDPDAEGVLPVALGRATRLFNFFLEKKKEYKAEFQFGIQTDTLDATGNITKTDDKIILKKEIIDILPQMIGEINQIPPKYSAKSINGKRAYELARKGIDFELKSKRVTVYDMELIKQNNQNCFEFKIICSGGTYIRAIARDMAKLLGTVGIMKSLIRTASGVFRIENSIDINKESIDINKHILPMDYILNGYEKYYITESEKKELLDGKKKIFKNLPDGYFCVYTDAELIGIGKKDDLGRLEVSTWLL